MQRTLIKSQDAEDGVIVGMFRNYSLVYIGSEFLYYKKNFFIISCSVIM